MMLCLYGHTSVAGAVAGNENPIAALGTGGIVTWHRSDCSLVLKMELGYFFFSGFLIRLFFFFFGIYGVSCWTFRRWIFISALEVCEVNGHVDHQHDVIDSSFIFSTRISIEWTSSAEVKCLSRRTVDLRVKCHAKIVKFSNFSMFLKGASHCKGNNIVKHLSTMCLATGPMTF